MALIKVMGGGTVEKRVRGRRELRGKKRRKRSSSGCGCDECSD